MKILVVLGKDKATEL